MKTIKGKYDPGVPHTGKYFAYLRVSTKGQSVERQQKDILDYLNGGDFEIYWYREEGKSGSLPIRLRPELKRAVEDCTKAKGTLIVTTLDRLSRKKWHAEEFFAEKVETNKLKFVVTEDPALTKNPMYFAMKAMVSEMERENTRQKTRSSLKHIQDTISRTGKHVTKEGKIITKLGAGSGMEKARQAAAETVSQNADSFAENLRTLVEPMFLSSYTTRAIAEALNNAGVDTYRGGSWSPGSVYNLKQRLKKLEEETNEK